MKTFEKLGRILATKGVETLMKENAYFKDFVVMSLVKYQNCDWGDLCEEDKQMNDQAIINGDRVLAKYIYKDNISIYIITEWDRSATTILFPEEY